MPGPGCVQCASGEWQCGPETEDLCISSGGWTPAGALCLQFYLMKHPRTGQCILKVQPKLLKECAPTRPWMPEKVFVSVSDVTSTARKTARKKRVKRSRK